MNPLGIERLSVFDMPPVDFVRMAADLGCDNVGLTLAPTARYNPEGFPDWSLRDDAAMRRELKAALADTGLGISVLEGFAVIPDRDISEAATDLDLLCELGGDRIAIVSVDKDRDRTLDQFAIINEMARERGIMVTPEIGSMVPLDVALAAIAHVGDANFRLMVDTMHWFRLVGDVATFAEFDSQLIGYVQLCDVPLVSTFDSYMEEAMYNRLPPGEGELPLLDFARLIPPDVPVSLEIPQRALAEAGLGPRERLAPCVAAARQLLAEASK